LRGNNPVRPTPDRAAQPALHFLSFFKDSVQRRRGKLLPKIWTGR
jgi:hypothetical protein